MQTHADVTNAELQMYPNAAGDGASGFDVCALGRTWAGQLGDGGGARILIPISDP